MTDQPKKLKEIVGEKFFRENNLDKKRWKPRDIRSREIGFSDFSQMKKENIEPKFVRRDYEASSGLESFLSFETPDEEHLFALLRLRKPSADFKPQYFSQVLHKAALVREVHSYGVEIAIGNGQGLGQHRGLGHKLLFSAEKIAKEEWKLKRITIIAGVGTREYYRKFGYKLRGTYMTKKL